MSDYPFTQKVRIALEAKNETLAWLLAEFERSERWFYLIKDFTKLELWEVEKFSDLLGVNFMVDYNHWKLEHQEEPLHFWSEPSSGYTPIVKKININIKLSAAPEIAEKNTSKLLATIRREGEKLGFEIE